MLSPLGLNMFFKIKELGKGRIGRSLQDASMTTKLNERPKIIQIRQQSENTGNMILKRSAEMLQYCLSGISLVVLAVRRLLECNP
jgi:hypothetical protein